MIIPLVIGVDCYFTGVSKQGFGCQVSGVRDTQGKGYGALRIGLTICYAVSVIIL